MSPDRVAGAYGGLGLDQVDDDDGTITRQEARAAWPTPNGDLPKPKPVKLCACGCGKPFEPKGAQKYVPGHGGGRKTATKKPRATDGPAAHRPEPAGVGGPAPAGPGGNQKAPPQAEVWRIVADLHRNIVGATIEVHIGDVRLVVRP